MEDGEEKGKMGVTRDGEVERRSEKGGRQRVTKEGAMVEDKRG